MEKSTNKNKYTLLLTFGRFISLIYKSLDAWKIMIVYGAIITLLYYILSSGQLLCNKNNLQCYLRFQLFTVAFMAFVCMCYIVDFYQNIFKNGVFKYSSIVMFDKIKIKSVLFLTAYVLSFVVSAFVAKYIVFKPANPDWRIEFIYFVLLFIFCMLPILAMRFSVIVAFYFNEQKLPPIRYLYQKTSGRSYIGIIGFLLTILIMAVFNMQTYGYVMHFTEKYPSSVSVEVLSTFFDILVKLLTFNVIFCFFEAQRQLMLDDEDSFCDNAVNKSTPEFVEMQDNKDIETSGKKRKKHKKISYKRKK
ncbi:MAG: hypothetical protein IJ677_06360 [Alphaproteobacteria bacterium]|nr:hypothetical protein [Alphaproteobacteria bacterium]